MPVDRKKQSHRDNQLAQKQSSRAARASAQATASALSETAMQAVADEDAEVLRDPDHSPELAALVEAEGKLAIYVGASDSALGEEGRAALDLGKCRTALAQARQPRMRRARKKPQEQTIVQSHRPPDGSLQPKPE